MKNSIVHNVPPLCVVNILEIILHIQKYILHLHNKKHNIMNIGIAIRNIRKERMPQLNQSEFAKKIGITQTYLSQIETGAKTPNISVLETISKEFEIPLPIIFWLGISEEDITEHKREYFRFLKPTVDSMINEFF